MTKRLLMLEIIFLMQYFINELKFNTLTTQSPDLLNNGYTN